MFLRTVSSFFKELLCSGFMEWIVSSVFPVILEVTFKASSNSFFVILPAGNFQSLYINISHCYCSQFQQLLIVLSLFSVFFYNQECQRESGKS